ncbi:MAG TPA: hypothetical protein VGD43_03805, partial [Micromonospora sp.]
MHPTSHPRHQLPAPLDGLLVAFEGSVHPAREIARGAAYELFSAEPAPGFAPDPRPDAPLPHHRYAHASEVSVVRGHPPDPGELDSPLLAPVNRTRTWADLHALSQQPAAGDDLVLAAVRASAVIRPGTPMVRVLSVRQLVEVLHGGLPHGFCHREYDVAHLRTPTDLAPLRTEPEAVGDGTAYLLRWRAVDPYDYQCPAGPDHRGLVEMPPHDRMGPPVLGTGFTPSQRHLVPEFVTRDLADLPIPANAALVAYPPTGGEVVLWTYQAERRGWLRMTGPRWRQLMATTPGVPLDQEYVPTGELATSTRLVGLHQGQEHEAVADPPDGFRVLALNRAARFPVDRVRRRLRFVSWRGATCLLLREESGWLRL